MNDTVFAVVTGVADDFTIPNALYSFRDERFSGTTKVMWFGFVEDEHFVADLPDQFVPCALDTLTLHADTTDLRDHFRQWNQAAICHRIVGDEPDRTVSQRVQTIQHAHRHGLAADRAVVSRDACCVRCLPDSTLAVPVHVVLSLFGKELNRTRVAFARFERPLNREVIHVGLESAGFTAQFRR